LIVRIRDDGIGLPLERLQALRSHGLAAMRQRAVALGGQWRVLRATRGGTEIEVRLPLEKILVTTPAVTAAAQGTTAAAG
jgi:signal transduction histidine kinase